MSSTLVVTLTEPDESFPEKVAGTPFFPCHRRFFEETGGRYGLETKYLVTNGPFTLSNWSHGESLRLTKAEGYHDQGDVYPAVVRYIIGEPENPLAALKAGTLDAAELSPEQAKEAADAGMRVVELEDTIQMLWLNNGVSALSSAKVRTALRDALEWDAVMEQAKSAVHVPAEGYIAPDAVVGSGEKYRTGDNARVFSTDRAAAAQALADGLSEKALTAMPRLTVLCADDADSQRVALYVIQSWQKNLDIYAELEPLSPSQLTARVSVGNYQAAICPSTAPGLTAMDALGMYVSHASKGNWARFGGCGLRRAVCRAAGGSRRAGGAGPAGGKVGGALSLHSPDLPAPKHWDPGRGQRLDHPALRRRRLRRSGGFPTGGKGRRLSAGRFYPPAADRQEALTLMDRRGIPWRYCGETPAFKERPTQRGRRRRQQAV